MDKKPTEHFEDSYDEAKLSSLKKEIALPKSLLFQLVNDDDKLTQKLRYFNHEGCKCIDNQQFYEAIVFLNEAEVTLEYAASCGKTIERSLIITTLHNAACVYQRIWELEKSADYLEGIIYNICLFLEGQPTTFQPIEDLLDDRSVQLQRLAIRLQNRLKLANYYLQFCAVNSQLKRHQSSLSAASRSLDILKEVCEQMRAYEAFTGAKYNTQLEKNILLQLRNIKDFKEETADLDQNIERFLNKAKKSIGMFQKKLKFSCALLDNKQRQQLREFSIGSVMQIYPQNVPDGIERRWLREELHPLGKLRKALLISIAHFTMATELRLIAGVRYGAQSAARKVTAQFKSSQLHHLIAIITLALYVPYETVYFQHILNSYKTHYNVDLTQISESTLSEEVSNSLTQDDEIHLQISSLYRKKEKEKEISQHQKSSVRPADTLHSISPSLHDQLKRSKNHKLISGKRPSQTNSVQQKCKMITDSQRTKKENKQSKGKLGKSTKKTKSKNKVESRAKQSLQSPSSKKIVTHEISRLPQPPSRSKSKPKKKSSSKYIIENNKGENGIRSLHEYGFKVNVISRTNNGSKPSLKNSEKRSQLKRSDFDLGCNDIRFIRQGKSPVNIPKNGK